MSMESEAVCPPPYWLPSKQRSCEEAKEESSMVLLSFFCLKFQDEGRKTIQKSIQFIPYIDT
ncbi:hypothetical protein BA724_04560 [Domibacillus iocasae]|uniref:Uncharacterized protein n=1 Tax=Domibacillus iocasae TaxID=1714016 RepID=A0A1E7DQK7_9BACI|nr:hypothetical protein BA724_04560 [Domibacillus iocasae]